MSTVKLQNFIFPDEKYCDEPEMFFRGIDSECCNRRNRSIKLNEDTTVSFNSYFNSFSVGKWREHTGLSNLSLTIKYRGDIEITAYNAIGRVKNTGNYDIWNRSLSGENFYAKRKKIKTDIVKDREEGFDVLRISFPELPTEGVLYISARAVKESVFYGGYYSTEACSLRDIRLGLCICTFKREGDLKRNIDAIKSEILQKQDSPLHNKLGVFISDNGNTLSNEEFGHGLDINIIPNKNAGGAGGFTRAMIEASAKNSFTHYILMDDDILLMPEILYRTYGFLQLLKDNYIDYMLGAHMLSLDDRYMLYESGAKRSGTSLLFPKRGWDLRNPAAVAANEAKGNPYNGGNPGGGTADCAGINYSGWWYSAIPASIVTRDNLPLPFFIYFDDVEFGVRNRKNGTILINGICVWHPQGIGKAAPRMTYYHIRNILISMCSDADRAGALDVIKYVSMYVFGNIVRYRYEEAEAALMALTDFFKGPEYFMRIDPEAKHAELAKFAYTEEPCDGTGPAAAVCSDRGDAPSQTAPRHPRLFTRRAEDDENADPHALLDIIKSALCLLLPATEEEKQVDAKSFGLPFRSAALVRIDSEKRKKTVLKRDNARAAKLCAELMKQNANILLQYEKTQDEYKKMKEKMTTTEFWEEYLGI